MLQGLHHKVRVLRRELLIAQLLTLLVEHGGECGEDQLAHLQQDLLVRNKDFEQVTLIILSEVRDLNFVLCKFDKHAQRVVHTLRGRELLPTARA